VESGEGLNRADCWGLRWAYKMAHRPGKGLLDFIIRNSRGIWREKEMYQDSGLRML